MKLEKQWPAFLFIAFTTCFLFISLWTFTDQFSYVLPLRDRWNSWNPLFNDLGLWETFTYQHGPHRLGIAGLLFKATSYLSHWNGRTDMFAQVIVYLISTLLALNLKFRLTGKWQITDILIPLTFLSLNAARTFITNPYIHGLIPLFTLLAANATLVKNQRLRLGLMGLIAFTAAYSGFSIVVSIAIFLYYFFKLIMVVYHHRKVNWINLTPLAIVTLAFIHLLITSRYNSIVMENSTSLWNYLKYFWISCFGFIVPNHTLKFFAVTAIITLVTLAVWVMDTGINRKQENPIEARRRAVLFFLIITPLIFNLLHTYGRGAEGIGNASASRYIPGTMSLVLGIYLVLLRQPPVLFGALPAILFTVLMVYAQTRNGPLLRSLKAESAEVRLWTECLLETEGDYDHCRSVSHIPLMQRATERKVPEKILFLRDHKLNIFYRDSPKIRKRPSEP